MKAALTLRCLVIALLLPWPAFAADFELGALMQLLAAVPAAKDNFVETRTSALLTAPLVLKGTLAYVRPDRLEKHVLSPYEERISISGKSLTIENRSLKLSRTFSLDASAAVSALVESVRATLSGDRATLERHYAIQLVGRADAWTLTLVPRDPKLVAQIRRIEISGSRERLKRVEIEEATADRSVMLISPGQP